MAEFFKDIFARPPGTSNSFVPQDNQGSLLPEIFRTDPTARLIYELRNLPENKVENEATGLNNVTLKDAENGIVRNKHWRMTTLEWEEEGFYLNWAAGPSDVSWNMAQRSSHVKNMLGTVLHVWPDSGRQTFYDEIVLSLNLQAGNLIPIYSPNAAVINKVAINAEAAGLQSGSVTYAPGLHSFYYFMQLLDAPKLRTTLGHEGEANLVKIEYTSVLFPDLTLYGMFDSKGITFSDRSSNPNTVESWSADFIVYYTNPQLSTNSGQRGNSLLETFLNSLGGTKYNANANVGDPRRSQNLVP